MKTYLLIVLISMTAVHAWVTRSKIERTNKPAPEPATKPAIVPVDDDKASFDQIFEVNENLNRGDAFSADNEEVSLHEGDIVMTPKLNKYLLRKKLNPDSEDSPLDAISNGAWPGAIVPYTFGYGFSYASIVKGAIKEYEDKTCIKFVPRRASHSNYVEFMHGGGCYSMIGRQGGKQQISLGRGCGYKGIAIHEMMHALGFFHEQSRLDRDSYITVNYANIQRSMWYNFEKYKRGQASTLGEPYDKRSVMHYGNYAFSINRQKTIVSKSDSGEVLGQRNGLSVIDVKQLKKYYKCPGTETRTTTTTTTTKAPTAGCSDDYSFCSTLSKNGVCSNDWVKNKCRKSCKHSSCLRPPCLDKNSSCNSWSKYNDYCKYTNGCCKNGDYVVYMKGNCQKSCGIC